MIKFSSDIQPYMCSPDCKWDTPCHRLILRPLHCLPMRIHTLSLWEYNLDNEAVKLLLDLDIHTLEIGGEYENTIDAKGLAILAKCKINTLVMRGNTKIEDNEAIALASGNFTTLILNGNCITNEGAIALAKSNIRHLHLTGNNIEDDGAIALANSNIHTLHFCENLVSDVGIIALAYSNIHTLSMRPTNKHLFAKSHIPNLRIGDPAIEARSRQNYLNYVAEVPRMLNVHLSPDISQMIFAML